MVPCLKRLFALGLVALSIYTLDIGCKKFTHGFSIHSILGELDIPTNPLSDTLKQVLDQKFTYLGKGAQAYAFISEDRKWVIKFVRFDHLRAKPFIRLFSFLNIDYIQKRLERSKREIRELSKSFELAQTKLHEETALTHIQTAPLEKPVRIVDRLGIEHKINKAPFIIQSYAAPMSSVIPTLNAEECKALFNQLIQITRKKNKLGIYDKDPNILTNFGLLNGRLIEFDVGRFYKQDKINSKSELSEEILKISESLWPYVLDKDESLKEYLNQALADD